MCVKANDIKNLNGIMDGQTILSILRLSCYCCSITHCNMVRQIKVSQHARFEVRDEKNPGNMSHRDDEKFAAQSFVVLGHQEGWENFTV